jgi:hypothetical protein
LVKLLLDLDVLAHFEDVECVVEKNECMIQLVAETVDNYTYDDLLLTFFYGLIFQVFVDDMRVYHLSLDYLLQNPFHVHVASSKREILMLLCGIKMFS